MKKSPVHATARLGVNIDHVATLRQMRQTPYPDLLQVADLVVASGAHQITVHLREDRRHIQPNDVVALKKRLTVPLNLEMALTPAMVRFALKIKPQWVCLVPEKRQEVTTEGGLNLKSGYLKIKKVIEALSKKNIKVSLFIEPDLEAVEMSAKLKAHGVELHTGKYCTLFQKKQKYQAELKKVEVAARRASELGLSVHAGHGLCDQSIRPIVKLKGTRNPGETLVSEYNIGHYIIARAVTVGIATAVKEMLSEIENP